MEQNSQLAKHDPRRETNEEKNKTMTLLITTKKTENAFNLLFQKCLDISHKNKEECDYYRATWST